MASLKDRQLTETLERKERERRDTENAGCAMQAPEPVTLLDALVARRADMVREHNRKVKALDRMINMLEQSGAENIVAEASQLLREL